MQSLKRNYTNNLFIKEIHRLREETSVCQRGRIGGRDREFGIDMYTLLYLKGITNKVLLYRTANCPVWVGGELGREWTPIYVWLSPFTVHLNYHNSVIGSIPI